MSLPPTLSLNGLHAVQEYNRTRSYGAPSVPIYVPPSQPTSNFSSWNPPSTVAPIATFLFEPSNSSIPYGRPR